MFILTVASASETPNITPCGVSFLISFTYCTADPCVNYGCKQLCNIIGDTPMCSCNTGFTLDAKDGKNCIPGKNMKYYLNVYFLPFI